MAIPGIPGACPCPSAGPLAVNILLWNPFQPVSFMSELKIAISIQGECVKVSRKQKPEIGRVEAKRNFPQFVGISWATSFRVRESLDLSPLLSMSANQITRAGKSNGSVH